MEAAGLAIGVVGIIGAFRDVIELFDMFAAAKSLQHDATLIMMKLNIERFLLLRWAEAIGLVSPDHDPRLDDPATQELIAGVLACIQNLMSDAGELSNKYGARSLDVANPSAGLVGMGQVSQVSNASRLNAFFQEFANYQSRLINGDSSRVGVRKRARWAIHDKEKFTKLVEELAHFTGKLQELVPPVPGTEFISLSSLGLGQVDNHRSLTLIAKASRAHHLEIAEDAWNQLRKRKILDSLWFRKLHERKNDIKAAHESTLQWALKPPSEDVPWDDLAWWLRAGTGVYWICGKAGSGKSTLMNHVCDSVITTRLLSEWARGRECLTANFFFRNPGANEQNTLQGLSRSLLFQILSQQWDLIPNVLPDMWREQEASDYDVSLSQKPLTIPSLVEMGQAFDQICKKFEDSSEFLCLFVDGLDELSGASCQEGVSFLRRFMNHRNVKLLVSSRPIPECVDAFDSKPKLALQDLNHSDIAHYVDDVIGDHSYMMSLRRRFPQQAKKLTSELVDKSSGVFLWVVLACRSINDGFVDCDSIAELHQRIDDLPRELEDMFKLMLKNIGTRHRRQGAKLLRICFVRQQEIPKLDDRQKGRVPKEMYALALALASDYDTEPAEFGPLTIEDKRDTCKAFEGRLRSRTAGLLELAKRATSTRERGARRRSGAYCFCYQEIHDPWVDAEVQFLHRSVFEFLSQEHVWAFDCLALPDEGFDPNAALSMGALHLAFQTIKTKWPSIDRVFLHLYEGMIWGSKADAEKTGLPNNIFWHFHHLLDLLSSLEPEDPRIGTSLLWPFVQSHRHGPTGQSSHGVVRFAIQGGAVNFIKAQSGLRELARTHGSHCTCSALLKDAGTIKLSATSGSFAVSSPEMVGLLLSVGCDPNAMMGGQDDKDSINSYGETTPWMAWVDTVRYGRSVSPENPQISEILDSTQRFLEAGASRDIFGMADLEDKILQLSRCEQKPIEARATKILELLRKIIIS
ncbi:small s protein [Colletotrichum plurivorum]|uniref:Small s protein n=1 Tax=Colletotrichum plurivorum TaxID=2175906 RepID=A0A8H6KLI1_9PEZI|nr:small s protein [Colletotrichum plurivorum]